MSYWKDLLRRLRLSVSWVAAQYVLTLVLILIGLAWTRLPDKHVWQVGLTLLIPLLMAISALELEAGTMRVLANDDGKRVKLVYGACALLVWVALFWACWAALDWCDDRIAQWAGYLNSRASAGARATVFTFDTSSEVDDNCGVDTALDRCSRKNYPVCHRFRAVGLASAVSQDHSAVAELAVVAGGGVGGTHGSRIAGTFLRQPTEWIGLTSGLGSIAEGGRELRSGDWLLGCVAGVGSCVAGPWRGGR